MPVKRKKETAQRHFKLGPSKFTFDEAIDRHAEAYMAAYPEVVEFSPFEKSGTLNYYIGMVWNEFHKQPDCDRLRIRGSESIAKNKIVELDLSIVDSQQTFFPGQIVAFQAEPFLKVRLTVKKFLDPMRIAPPMKKIDTDDRIRLMVASGPYMKPDVEDWTLFDALVKSIKEQNATHVILMGPFVDKENSKVNYHYNSNWKLVFDKLVEGLSEHKCHVFIMPSNRDVLPSKFETSYLYPSPELDYEFKLKPGAKIECTITPVSDPSQIDLGGVYVDATSADVLFHMKQTAAFINKAPGSPFTPLFRQFIPYGIYPIYPGSPDVAIVWYRMGKYIGLDRLGPHIIIMPTNFVVPPVNNVENRLIITTRKCTVKQSVLMVEIPKIESSQEAPINSLVTNGYTHQMIELLPKPISPTESSEPSTEPKQSSEDQPKEVESNTEPSSAQPEPMQSESDPQTENEPANEDATANAMSEH